MKFFGYDGNNEAAHLGVARFLVEDLGRFERSYARMFEVFRPIRTTLIGHGLGDDDVIAILNARVHPDRKK